MVNIALTCDVERDYSIKNNMTKIHKIFKKYDVVGTWFIQHDLGKYYTKDCGTVDDRFPEIVNSLNEIGEIGTHVHFRNKNGRFQPDYDFQKMLIENATNSLRDNGYNIRSFRGGDHFFTKETFQILNELDYKIDSSIMQGFTRQLDESFRLDYRIYQKIDFFNTPYFLDSDNFLIEGKSNLLEIPVTNTLFFLNKPSYFVPFPTPGHMKLGFFSKLVYPLTKLWDFFHQDEIIVFLFHDFTFNSKNSMKYLEQFLIRCSKDDSIQFSTLSDISKKFVIH